MSKSMRLPAAALAVTAASLAGFAAILSSPERAVTSAVATALAQRFPANQDDKVALDAFDPTHVHLSNLPLDLPTGSGPDHVPGGMTVGDRITITARNGTLTVFRVVEVAPLSRQIVAPGGDRFPTPRLLLVTAVSGPVAEVAGDHISEYVIDPTSKTGGDTVRKVRFVIEAAADPVRPVPASDPRPRSL